ncbi:MAG: flagellar export chaperone FliS [Thermodesulfobacteriota bacterium]
MKGYGQKLYQQTQVATVDKGRLIVLLYEGAIKYLDQARECLATGDVPGKSVNINRAVDIIAELNQSLNLKDGGEIAGNLRRLYLFWIDHLLQAKTRKDTRNIEDVIGMMSSLNEAWNQVVSRPEAQEVVPPAEGQSLRAQITI